MKEEIKFIPDVEKKAGVFDDILSYIGEFGRYQRRVYLLLCLPAISCALHKLAWVFLGTTATHRCLLPFESLSNASFALPGQVANMSLPWDAARDSWSQCRRLDANFSEQYFEDGVPATQTVPCEDWIFDHSKYTSSAVFEFSLVCALGWARAAANTLMMLGDLMGSVIFGDLSDRFGRRPVFFFCLVLQLLSGILAWLAPTYLTLVLARLVIGATVPGIYIVGYVLGIEMVGPSKRQYAGVMMQMFFSVGYMLTALFAFLVPDWRNLQLALTLPGLFFLTYWWLIPESPRWLVGRGEVDKASVILQRAARENKQGVSPEVLEDMVHKVSANLKVDKSCQQEQPSLFHICRYPYLRRNTCIIFLFWFVNSISYYGLSWNTGNLGGNDYVNFVISGAVEIPAYLFVMFAINVAGRKPVLCGCMLTAAAALLTTALVPDEMGWLLTLLAMLGKMAVTAAFGASYIFSAEIFPTCVRNAGLGAASTLAGVGGMLAPVLILLSDYWRQLPLLVLGLLTLVSGLVALLLPETLNTDLPDSLQDGDDFARKTRKQAKSVTATANGKC